MLPSIETNLPTLPVPVIRPGVREADPESLNRAFEWFSEAAASLERSYSNLHTEVRHLRDELARKQDELDRSREAARRSGALAEVSAVLAHEIRNPLAGMELFTDLLLASRELATEARGWAHQIQAGLRTLTATVNNVLQMHAKDPGVLVPVQIGRVLEATVQFLAPMAQQSRIDVILEDATEDACLEGDPHKLQQVFLNLAMNAIRAMNDGGMLRFQARNVCHLGKREMEIGVEDTGCGITPQHLTKIFEPGFTTRAGSVGLGLAVCRKIIEQHQGTIRAESVEGRGTTIVLTIPAL